jgi:DNA/RNA-binding domain of Phe-tRNA-synthetase-like protein
VALDRLNDFVDEDVVEALRDIYKTFDAKVKSLEDGR